MAEDDREKRLIVLEHHANAVRDTPIAMTGNLLLSLARAVLFLLEAERDRMTK